MFGEGQHGDGNDRKRQSTGQNHSHAPPPRALAAPAMIGGDE
jgi:hypothetical protein